jgi:hypothetical protein
MSRDLWEPTAEQVRQIEHGLACRTSQHVLAADLQINPKTLRAWLKRRNEQEALGEPSADLSAEPSARRLAQSYGVQAVEALKAVMLNGRSDSARVAAAVKILEIAIGKPRAMAAPAAPDESPEPGGGDDLLGKPN